MLEITEGSMAVAEAVRLCRPQVVAAYPITPQTHIVEALAEMVANGRLDADYITVESEFSALSACLGASAAGIADLFRDHFAGTCPDVRGLLQRRRHAPAHYHDDCQPCTRGTALHLERPAGLDLPAGLRLAPVLRRR